MRKVLYLLLMGINFSLGQVTLMKMVWLNSEGKEYYSGRLSPEFARGLSEFLKREDISLPYMFSSDKIEVKFILSELRIEGIGFIIRTDNLHLKKYDGSDNILRDPKSQLLLKLFKLHFITNIWNYPNRITSLTDGDNYYLQYIFPDKKEIFISYTGYPEENRRYDFSLISTNYLKMERNTQIIKKKKSSPERNFIQVDCEYVYGDYYKYESNYIDYISPYIK